MKRRIAALWLILAVLVLSASCGKTPETAPQEPAAEEKAESAPVTQELLSEKLRAVEGVTEVKAVKQTGERAFAEKYVLTVAVPLDYAAPERSFSSYSFSSLLPSLKTWLR